jgi:phosphatidylglycerophosphate synthase
LIIPNLLLRGTFWWMLLGILAIDFVITVLDFLVERRSREMLGGLPTAEYILHLLMAILFGAFVMAIWLQTSSWSNGPSSVMYSPANVFWAVRAALAIMAVLVFASGILDFTAACRLSGKPADGQSEFRSKLLANSGVQRSARTGDRGDPSVTSRAR